MDGAAVAAVAPQNGVVGIPVELVNQRFRGHRVQQFSPAGDGAGDVIADVQSRVTLSPGLQRIKMEPAPALETILSGCSRTPPPKLMLPNEVTLVTPLPSTQPLMIEALTVKPG